MYKLLADNVLNEMIEEAFRIPVRTGIKTRSDDLLKKAAGVETLAVKNGRIYPSAEAMESCRACLKNQRVPDGDSSGHHHDWKDMIVNHFTEAKIIIKLSDLHYQYCNFRTRQIIPLKREHVIEGTKLIHVLSELKGIKGYTCGVPQDTAASLKPVEQYLIGYRYNRNGGGTIQSVAAEIEDEFSKIRAIAEDWEFPDQRSVMLFSPSPMVLDSDDLYLFFKKGIHITSFMIGSMPMMGMTGPVDPVGVYILSLSEVLGGAAILHAIFPEARVYIYPHPQAMDLRSGQMSFGTVEHARLEMMKIQVMKALELQYYNLKDIMTSAQMPGSMSQGDKALGFFTGLLAGYKAFNLMSLSTDQVWSPIQAMLDVDAVTNAWETVQPLDQMNPIERTSELITEVDESNILFAETADTLLNFNQHYKTEVLFNRFQSAETWQYAGRPEELDSVEQKYSELIDRWNYQPPQGKLSKIMDIYHNLCRYYNTEPLKID
jgi:trimethylamine:corrinoid methyltransferase-like protein